MRASTAFFVGIGTVCLAITGGLVGGLVIGNIMSPPAPKHAAESARPKQPMQPQPTATPLPNTGSTLAVTGPATNGKPTPTDQKADSPVRPAPPAATVSKAAASAEEPSKPADHAAARQPTQEDQKPAPAKPEAAPAKQANAPDDAYAKARNSDLKQRADRRRAERAQRWAERHGHGRDQNQEQNEDQNQQQAQDQTKNQGQNQAQDQNRSAHSEQQAREDRDTDRGNSSANYSSNYSDRRYRDDSRRQYRNAERDDDDRRPGYYADEGPRFGFPRIQLFGPDD